MKSEIATLSITKNDLVSFVETEEEARLQNTIKTLESEIVKLRNTPFVGAGREGYLSDQQYRETIPSELLPMLERVFESRDYKYVAFGVVAPGTVTHSEYSFLVRPNYDISIRVHLEGEDFELSCNEVIRATPEEREVFDRCIAGHRDMLTKLTSELRKTDKELRELPKKIKLMKAAMIRKVLESSEQGEAVLEFLKGVQ